MSASMPVTTSTVKHRTVTYLFYHLNSTESPFCHADEFPMTGGSLRNEVM